MYDYANEIPRASHGSTTSHNTLHAQMTRKHTTTRTYDTQIHECTSILHAYIRPRTFARTCHAKKPVPVSRHAFPLLVPIYFCLYDLFQGNVQ